MWILVQIAENTPSAQETRKSDAASSDVKPQTACSADEGPPSK